MVEIELNSDFEEILIYAERYALGRRTYAVSNVVGFIRPMISLLETKTLATIRSDIEEVSRQVERTGIDGLWGMECDKREWLRLLSAIKIEMANRGGVSNG